MAYYTLTGDKKCLEANTSTTYSLVGHDADSDESQRLRDPYDQVKGWNETDSHASRSVVIGQQMLRRVDFPYSLVGVGAW